MKERRVHRRTQVQRQIELQPVGEPGSPSEGIRAAGPSPASAEATIAPGRLINVGCGGMCGQVDQALDIGTPCTVRIHDTEGEVQETKGEVRNFRRGDEGHLVGVAFEEPLLALGDTARRGPKVVHDHAAKPLVLVVDDDPNVRAVLDRFLTLRRLRVFPAADADEALRAIKRDCPSLMLLDLKMPKVGGLELLELLKRVGLDVPNIWAMSGYVSDEDAALALQLGASEFFNKPFDLDHIDYTLGLLAPML